MNEELVYFEGFAGYGGASFALELAEINSRCIGYSEIDKYAIQCYEKNHPDVKNYGDISKIDPEDLPDFDCFFGGFPCQDVSIAGKRDLSKGRTMLVEHIFRICAAKKPKYIFLENVKGLLSTEPLWTNIKWTLKQLGYDLAYKVLNSKEHGVPQNRERIWIIGSRDGFVPFKRIFPLKEPLTITLKDILEPVVDDKYYLNEQQQKKILITPDISYCLDKNYYKGTKVDEYKHKKRRQLIYHKHRNEIRTYLISTPTLTCSETDNIYVYSMFPRTGNPDKGGTGHLYKSDGTTYNVDTGNCQSVQIDNTIRKLTSTEAFRLMGFLNDEIKLDGLSDTQCYKLAGNGWEIVTVSKILKLLFGDKYGR